MTLTEILKIMENRIIVLNEARKAAVINGDLEQVNKIDTDLLTTASSIETLKTMF